MKKILTFITLALIVVSCNKEFDNAMKSADKEVILKAADKYYEKKELEAGSSTLRQITKSACRNR